MHSRHHSLAIRANAALAQVVRSVAPICGVSACCWGLGIPPDKLESIFDPFVQGGRALNRPCEGTGLGLAISRDLARAMGGDLTTREHARRRQHLYA